MASKSRSKTAAHAAERGSRPAGERLHRDGEARAELRERRALASEAWEVASFPFAPHINERPAGSAPPSRPLHERLEEEVASLGLGLGLGLASPSPSPSPSP